MSLFVISRFHWLTALLVKTTEGIYMFSHKQVSVAASAHVSTLFQSSSWCTWTSSSTSFFMQRGCVMSSCPGSRYVHVVARSFENDTNVNFHKVYCLSFYDTRENELKDGGLAGSAERKSSQLQEDHLLKLQSFILRNSSRQVWEHLHGAQWGAMKKEV